MAIEFDENTWKAAKNYAQEFAAFPPSFQQCIRALRQNHLSNLQKASAGLDHTSMQLLLRLLNSKTLKACFYFAMLNYYGDTIHRQDRLDTKGIVSPFGPGSLASILALVYLNKYSRRLVKEGWEAFSRRIQESSEIGGLLGQAVPSLGFDASIFIGPMRHIALAAVLSQKSKVHLEYKRHLNKIQLPYDSAWEIDKIGCTLGQIGSILIQNSGFGIPYANAFFEGTSARFDEVISPEASAFRMVAVWSESILLGCSIPRVEGEDEYAMEEYQMRNLLTNAEEIRENGSKYSYLNRSKDDLNPAQTPLLFTAEERAAASTAEEDEIEDLIG